MPKPFESNLWAVCENYELINDAIAGIGPVVKQTNLSHEEQHFSMLRDWLSLKSEDDLVQWLCLYGLPDLQKPKVSEYLKLVKAWRFYWRLMIEVRDDLESLEKRALLFLSERPRFRILRIQDTSFIDLHDSTLKNCAEISVGRKNLEAVRSGRNPFPVQKAKLVDQSSKHKLKPRMDTNRASIALLDDGGTLRFGPQIGINVDDWLKDWRLELRKSAAIYVTWFLNYYLADLHPIAVSSTRNQEISFNSQWQIATPIQAMMVAFFKESTHSSLLKLCPNPTCGKFFLLTRTDKKSCGLAKCQKFVTKRKER